MIYEKWNNRIDLVVNGGYGDNIPSTVINLCGDEPLLIRQGKGGLDI